MNKEAFETGMDRIPTNLRTLLILEVLATTGEAMTATELGQSVGLAKQTAHRLCIRLEAEGFITRQGRSKRYIPARRLRELSAGLLYVSSSHIARHQVLEEIAKQTGETVNFVIPEPSGMRYLDRVETGWPLRVQLPVGSNVPFHCTASGKTFMASLPPKARRDFVAALTLQRHTARTHITCDSLLSDLTDVARRGYAVDDQEFVEGMHAISVPINDKQGRFMAALAIHGPSARMTPSAALARKDVLVDGAQRLSETLFSD